VRDPWAGTEVTIPGRMVPAIHRGCPGPAGPAALDGGIGPAVSASWPPTPSALVEGAHGTRPIRCTTRRAVVLHLPAGFYTTCSHVSAPGMRVVRLCR
jgi:hypothetical protein